MNDEYINNYIDIVIEYLCKMKASAFIKSQPNCAFMIYTGFKAITNIFQIHFVNTNDPEGSFYSGQKAYILYLEYLEQMQQTNMSHDLNHTDAIHFVYNRTISQFTLRNTAGVTDDFMIKISSMMETILWFGNSQIDPAEINKTTILKLIKLDIRENIELAQKRVMNKGEYDVFLTEAITLLSRISKKKRFQEPLYILNGWSDHLNVPIKPWCKWLIYGDSSLVV
jgi:hypothetical protein